MGGAAIIPFVPRSNMRSGKPRLLAPDAWAPELEHFDEWLRSKKLPTSTRKMRNYQLRCFAHAVGKPPYDVTLADITSWLGTDTWKPATCASNRSAVRSFYKWATIHDKIGRNPAEFVEVVQVPKGLPRPVDDDVLEAAIASAPAREAVMMRFAAYAGLRCCEVAAVHRRDLVIERIHDDKGKKRNIYSLRVCGKGSKERMVPLAKDLAKIVLAHEGYLFQGLIDGHVSAAYVSKILSRCLPPGVTAHMLRHRFASKAYQRSKDIRAVQELLGHASVATTQIYTAIDAERLRRAALAA